MTAVLSAAADRPGPAGERSPDTVSGVRFSAADVARLVGLPHLPTAEQARVVEAPLEPLLVVAGAGSGKTETMAARVVWLVANGIVGSDEILGLTFTRKAAGELADRIDERLRRLRSVLPGAPAWDRPRISTYNAYAGAIVRDHALRLGLDPNARLLTEAGRWQIASRVVETWSGDLSLEHRPSTVIQAVLGLAGSLAEHLLGPDEARARLLELADGMSEKAPSTNGRERDRPRTIVRQVIGSLRARAELMDLVAEFGRRKQELGVVDFGDQVALARRVAVEVPQVGRGERDHYRVVLLDEYQDTSVAQVALLSALFTDGHPVTAVGDPHQAIYGWRGASAGALARFPRTFPRRDEDGRRVGASVATLATSWRNDRAILDAANVIAGPLRRGSGGSQGGVPSTRVRLPVLAARPDAGAGRVRAFYAETSEQEAAQIAEAVASCWSPAVSTHSDVRPATAAVLCRARAQMPAVAEALRAAGLPVEIVGLGGLLTTPEVSDLRAALLMAHDPSRADAAMRLLTGLRLGIADLDVLQDAARRLDRARADGRSSPATSATHEALSNPGSGSRHAEPAGLVEAVERPPGPEWTGRAGRAMTPVGLARVRQLGEALSAIRAQRHLPLPDLVAAAERQLGLDIELLARPGAEPHDARRHLDEFTEVAAEFARGSQTPTLGAFLAWLEAALEWERGLDTGDVEPDPGAVQVLTVHAAKGLEWDVVAVAGLADGIFPSYRGTAAPEEIPPSSAWFTALDALPYPIRGDASDLPHLRLDEPADHADMAAECERFRVRAGAHEIDEERRLAYVAVTRARRELILAGSWWREDAKNPRRPSRFLLEVAQSGALGSVFDCTAWGAPADPTNPGAERRSKGVWPAPMAPERVADVQRAVAAVEAARAAVSAPAEAARLPDPPALSPRAAGWWRDADLLLAEREARRRPEGDIVLPAHLSASAVVRLVADPGRFALDQRRPVPREPTVRARRGTRFHEWVERHFGAAPLLDLDDLAGADDAAAADDPELAALQRAFLGSPWATRTPLAIEAELETPVAGLIVRCRVDAVFPAAHGVEIVDWKTGRRPEEPVGAARLVQLAVYRLAWARLHRLPLTAVRAMFYYVAGAETVEAPPMTDAEIHAAVSAHLKGGLWG